MEANQSWSPCHIFDWKASGGVRRWLPKLIKKKKTEIKSLTGQSHQLSSAVSVSLSPQ